MINDNIDMMSGNNGYLSGNFRIRYESIKYIRKTNTINRKFPELKSVLKQRKPNKSVYCTNIFNLNIDMKLVKISSFLNSCLTAKIHGICCVLTKK